MEASLVLLQERMCWSLQDITYLNQNQRKDKERNKMTHKTRFVIYLVSSEENVVFKCSLSMFQSLLNCPDFTYYRSSLKQWLWADYMLYEHFQQLLEKRLIDFGADAVHRKVELLKVKYHDRQFFGLYKILIMETSYEYKNFCCLILPY